MVAQLLEVRVDELKELRRGPAPLLAAQVGSQECDGG